MVSRLRRVLVSIGITFMCAATVLGQGRGGGGRGGGGGDQGGQAGRGNQQQTQAQQAALAARQREIQATVKLADDLAAGQPAPNDFGLAWMREDFMKAGPSRQYVPFTVTVDASKFTGQPVSLYWRVAAKNAAPVPAAPAAPAAAGAPAPRAQFAYEDINFIAGITPGAGGVPARISRSFSVPAGPYDVFVAIKETTSAQPNAAPPKMAVLKQTINVPDFWTTDLNTSSVLVAERIDPVGAPLTAEQMVERPYALGPIEITPVASTKFTKLSTLKVFLLIYNAKADAASKPDVTVEYNFCQAAAGTEAKEGDVCKAGEKFFNKTNAQGLNAQLLPPEFSLAAGHQLQTGQEVPLASFPEGTYRLEIKVTDKLATKSVTKDINFTVSGS